MNTKPKILFMPHANIQYCQMNPVRREWVIRNSYEKIFDIVASRPEYRIAFEASGSTVEEIATKTPDVLDKLKDLIDAGKVEAVGSPYTHIAISNIDPEIGVHTLKHGLDTWEKFLGVRPIVGWSPECSWCHSIPDMYKEAGFKSLIMDADSFLLSFKDIRQATGLEFDVAGHSNKNHIFKIEEYIQDKLDYIRYVTNPTRIDNGMTMLFRSDMMSNLMLWYLMGATEGYRNESVSIKEIETMLARWKERIAASGTYIMPYAEDAEYIGTTAYFYVKQFGQARFFEPEPESVNRFQEILDCAIDAGYQLSTPQDIFTTAKETIDNPHIKNVENGIAWHGGTAKAWANTYISRVLDPACKMVFDGIKAVAAFLDTDLDTMDELLRQALKKVTAAYVSDARWPPKPTSPGRFDVQEALDALKEANGLIRLAMEACGIVEDRSLYSPELMETQIAAVSDELMSLEYFGEKAAEEKKVEAACA